LGDLRAPWARAGEQLVARQGRHCGSWSLREAAFEVSGASSESPVPTPLAQDCLRACQEQIEALLESSLRQAQQQNLDPKAAEEEEEEEEVDLACTPTDVRDVNI
jgi:G1/S-specific cyclin-D1